MHRAHGENHEDVSPITRSGRVARVACRFAFRNDQCGIHGGADSQREGVLLLLRQWQVDVRAVLSRSN
jgi:hypothetical protein